MLSSEGIGVSWSLFDFRPSFLTYYFLSFTVVLLEEINVYLFSRVYIKYFLSLLQG